MTLIERIEQAEGPSRELDAEIARAVGWFTKAQTMRFAGSDAEVTEHYWTYEGDTRGAWSTIPPHAYTSSIDAAIALVPTEPFPGLRPGTWWWMVDNLGCDAHVAYENHDSGIPEYGARAATPALAICAAALRARGL